MAPQQYLIGLKDLMMIEIEKIKINKTTSINSKDYEAAAFYRDIERKLLDFINSLGFRY